MQDTCTRFFISSSSTELEAALNKYALTVTVEAEYGDRVVEGTIATLAHHGPRAGNPCPCLALNLAAPRPEAIGLSHLDLDALGGCLAVLGRKPSAHNFWKLAAFIDINGPHKMSEAGASDEDIRRLYAFWAYSKDHRVFPPRDGSVTDITETVLEYAGVLESILCDDPDLLAAGDEFRKAGEALDKASFVKMMGEVVVVRESDRFVNHLYGNGKAVVARNTETGAVTLSLADSIPGVSCCKIAQQLWGEKAGGRAGYAGSPRGKKMERSDLDAAASLLAAAIRKSMGQ